MPGRVVRNEDLTAYYSPDEIAKFVKSAGVTQRRFVDEETTSSDLCFHAAERLLKDMAVDRGTIDCLIFVSQTPDFHFPASATILQHRLGLGKSTAAFDISLGCTGFVYGLSVAYAYLQQPSFRRVLLLVGETPSKITSMRDKATALLFGDAGAATLIERTEGRGAAFFSLNSDGGGEDTIKIPAGGYRHPSSEGTLLDRGYPDGSVRNDHQQAIDGMEVFNFAMREVSKDIIAISNRANAPLESLDFFVFHQANKFITDFLVKKLRLRPERVPCGIAQFGNTSSASIPLTIVTEARSGFSAPAKALLSSFGVGLSWADAIIVSDRGMAVSDLVELP